MIAQYIDAFDAKHGRVIIQADTMPAVFPGRGDAIDGLPDDYVLEPGSVLYVLGNGTKMTTWVLGADGMWHSTGTDAARPAGGMVITFHLLNEDGTPHEEAAGVEMYAFVARTAIVQSRSTDDVVAIVPITLPDAPDIGTASTTTAVIAGIPAEPDEYLIRLTTDGVIETDSGQLADDATWEAGWYDPYDTSLADRVAYTGGQTINLDYTINVTPAE